MSVTRILCDKCGHPLCWCACKKPGATGVAGPSETQPRAGALRSGGLVSCVRHLGLRLGWRYWRLQKKCEKDPAFVSVWAFSCLVEANEAEWRGDEKLAKILRQWSQELRAHHAAYTANSRYEPPEPAQRA